MTQACSTAEPGVEIDTLTFPQQFLVWSVRAWVDGYKSGTGRAGLLREGFALAGAADGWLVVEELMSIIATSARRPLDMRCLACRALGEDEAPLLAASERSRIPDRGLALVHWPVRTNSASVRLADRSEASWSPPSGSRTAA